MSGDSSKIEELVAKYELLSESGGGGLRSVEEKLNNDVLSGWLDIASSGALSPEQIEDIRRRCTVSFATRKRKAVPRSTSTGDENSGNSANNDQNEKRRSRATTSKKSQSIRRADEQEKNVRDSESPSRSNEDGGDLENEQQDESVKKDPPPIVLSRDAKLAKAREYLAEMRGKRDDYLNQSGNDGHDTPYLLVRLPSLMEQTETTMEWFFEDSMSEPVDECIRMVIQDAIDLYDLGMRAAVSFLDAADKAWIPVCFTSLASLANDLEELCISTISESFTRKEVKGALVHARDSELFELPTQQSPKHLAKHFLTMNVATKGYLLNLVHCAAGCGMFNSLDIEDLTTGKDPIVSRDVLTILNYDQGSTPEDTNDLLKSMKKGFDDQSNTHSDKTKLMLCFLRIRLEIHHLSDERWETMEKHGSSNKPDSEPVTVRSQRYFDTQARKTNAMIALTMLTASTFIHEHTSSYVDYGDDQTGVDVLLYRNTIPFLFQSIGTKLLMAKTYDGTASDEYMESVHTGLGDLATKAATSSIGSKYHDDIAVLFDLDNDDEEDHDDLLVILGYDKYGDNGDDMEFDSVLI